MKRFLATDDALGSITFFLVEVWEEADRRHYNFDLEKISEKRSSLRMNVIWGQLEYELGLLSSKLLRRVPAWVSNLPLDRLDPNPVFRLIETRIEGWGKGQERMTRMAFLHWLYWAND